MLNREQILGLFEKLNAKLQTRDVKGEVGIVGGAVMCVVYKSRESTKDVDGIFVPASVIRELAGELAVEEEITSDWLNDGAKGYLTDGFQREEVLQLSNLLVWAPQAEYMLAMKALSARFDSLDKTDVLFLANHLGLTSANQVGNLVAKYYPKKQIPAKTAFFLEELFEGKK